MEQPSSSTPLLLSSSSSSSFSPPLPLSPRTNNAIERTPLPTPSPAVLTPALSLLERRKRRNRQKTEQEKQKGDQLNDDTIGIVADHPCENCRKARDVNCKCMVARNPKKFNSWKCGNCLRSKRKCSFNVDNPGVEYAPLTKEGAESVERKKKANARRDETRRAKAVAAEAQEADYTPRELEAAQILVSVRTGERGWTALVRLT
ncbi:hypothetical protein F5B22DRAFT_660930 [Xylaria bambusicola]|uniref:uncharacterized protein n=1 Tax=Xylaria bambusicola TaxID=326684 RepID=UPI002007F3A1|nr:uncharacterized protein F5B22DRAFT_660930 [Xylaria bambusicola]KAI0505892.1 hypothetical protein F5B22DRAFT_660930 [Xylaria bambusicola]